MNISSDEKKVFGFILLVSSLIIAFLFWLIYFKGNTANSYVEWVSFLPALNAFLNTLTATFLVTGHALIKKNRIDAHKKFMLMATVTSAFFLMSYITYHHFHGDSKFLGTGIVRPIYFFILISHILLSVVQVPLILITLYLGLMRKFQKHRKFARVTFPIWLYVSISGVMIFVFLNWFNV